ncbi:MAG: hypothetical protein KJN82_06935 [Bacteroidia bacterium]|nr:hypothetical protein [Bacteroidia bacterium]
MKKFSLIIFLICTFYISAQEKIEKEERVDFSIFPEKAKEFMSLFSDFDKVKHFKEIDGKKVSYESKLKHKKQIYSIEFSQEGVIEDIEVTTRFKRIPKSIKNIIKSYLKDNYLKYHVIKTQKQFVFNKHTNYSDYVQSILNTSKELSSKYEIVLEVKLKNKKTEQREFLFNELGEFISFRVVKPLSYDYVLY